MSNNEFPRVLTLLRKEKGLSQKSAASSLGVSQALLSHYEKGIRECGLDFLIRAADFYGVSADYLLGRSASPDGMTVSVEEIPEPEQIGKENSLSRAGVLPVLNKKLIANSLNVLFDLLARCGSKELTVEVSAYLMTSVYRMFRILYDINPANQPDMFGVPRCAARGYSDAEMQRCEANAAAIGEGNAFVCRQVIPDKESLLITTERLSRSYPLFAPSLLNLIQNCENRIRSFREK
ncbi:MAG TPA: helix-turn-helix domain-containing protein [Oscillospiraceae bacterium]|nr:helix-turn-helix domain-containing protein [Oscillospiraceae bacterium]HNW03811.1 helix-turn-helix domain-containing protein [Oscillospiraceae bacterium]